MRCSALTFVAIASLVLVLAASSATGTQPALEPGMWRITLTSTTNGKADPAQESTQCLGEELKDLAGYFAPQLEEADATCERERQPSKDRGVTYRMHCRGTGLTVDALTGATIEDARHFTVTMRIETRTPNESALVIAKGKGRRTGTCPEK